MRARSQRGVRISRPDRPRSRNDNHRSSPAAQRRRRSPRSLRTTHPSTPTSFAPPGLASTRTARRGPSAEALKEHHITVADRTEIATAPTHSACCTPEAQTTCCEPTDKAECCVPDAPTCGCSAGIDPDSETDIREVVRAKYAAAASGRATDPATTRATDANGIEVWGAALYHSEADGAPAAAVAASMGCGVPTAVAVLHEGETVLDLGSGAGADVLISARRVGPTGRAIGIDMTDEMLDLARANAAQAGVTNVEFVKGYLEDLPLPDASVDVVISNCVINLAADKTIVLREAARVLRPGGRLAISDVIADADLDQATRADIAAWTGCIAGALTESAFRGALADAGFDNIEITPNHHVHEHAVAATIRARAAGGA
ncbi:MAG: arsenite methyltransferase [Solirubrobacteraceae bacterium]